MTARVCERCHGEVATHTVADIKCGDVKEVCHPCAREMVVRKAA